MCQHDASNQSVPSWSENRQVCSVPSPSSGDDPHDVFDVDSEARKRSYKSGIAEGENTTIGADHPISGIVRCAHSANDVTHVYSEARKRSHKTSVAEGKDSAV